MLCVSPPPLSTPPRLDRDALHVLHHCQPVVERVHQTQSEVHRSVSAFVMTRAAHVNNNMDYCFAYTYIVNYLLGTCSVIRP